MGSKPGDPQSKHLVPGCNEAPDVMILALHRNEPVVCVNWAPRGVPRVSRPNATKQQNAKLGPTQQQKAC
jgi:hypothetical protein